MESIKINNNYLVAPLVKENKWFLINGSGIEKEIEIRKNTFKKKYIWSNLRISAHMRKKLQEILIKKP